MARNGSGTYSKVNTFSAGTSITASGHNQNWDDLVTEMTNSVAADGQTTMTGPLKASSGSVAAPSYTYGADTDSGFYRIGANNIGLSLGGSKVVDYATTGVTITGTLTVSGTATFTTALGTTAIANDAITYAKIQNVSATNKLLGRITSGAGDVEEIGLGTGATFSGGNLVITAQLPRGYIDGCILSNGTDATNDINIAAGTCRDSTNAVDITVSAISGKQLDANWAAGGSAGMRNSAAGIADGVYHIYAVAKADGTQDIYAHTSTTVATVITALQAESGGADYLYARRIGSIIRRSNALLGFRQFGAHFVLTVPYNETVSTAFDTTQRNYTLAAVPTGASMLADVYVWAAFSGSVASIITGHPDCTLSTPTNTGGTPTAPLTAVSNVANLVAQSRHLCRTDTSAQIAVMANGTCTGYDIYTFGWHDQRGADA